jgi:transcriptional regulator with XRE-family HTH domain
MPIGKRIKVIRGDLSRPEFGQKIGVSQSAVQNYETLDQIPKGDVLQRIREVFGVDINWVLTGEGEPYHKGGLTELRAEDREGLWGTTKQIELDGKAFSVTEFSPSRPSKKHDTSRDPAGYDETQELFGRAAGGLRRIFNSRDPLLISAVQATIRAFEQAAIKDQHLGTQTEKLQTLEDKCQELQDKLNALKEQLEVKKSDV